MSVEGNLPGEIFKIALEEPRLALTTIFPCHPPEAHVQPQQEHVVDIQQRSRKSHWNS